MKQGRGRAYVAFDGIESELTFLSELHARTMDLVADLPDELLAVELHGYSVKWLFEHMVQAEFGWISRVAGSQQERKVSTCHELEAFTRSALAGLELGSDTSAGSFTCVGQVLRHLHWHWAHHSAQINVLRKAFGYEYEWTYQ